MPHVRLVAVAVPGAPAATSVAIDCKRGPWAGGVPEAPVTGVVQGWPGAWVAMNQLGHPCALAWLGLGVVVGVAPRPPPTWPTITMDVGILFAVVVPAGVNERLLVSAICSPRRHRREP